MISNTFLKKIYLSPPHMSQNELTLVQDAFSSNWIAPLGPHVDQFENEIADWLNLKSALAVSSGTAAIHLALRLLGLKQGDCVFTSTLTFIGTVNPVLYLGAKPVFIDSDLSTWNISPTILEAALGQNKKNGTLPKAVIAVNLYGQSCDMTPIQQICEYYNIPLIEDAAESLGATYKNQPSGSFGKFGILSFNGNKIITTSGGGMLVSNDSLAIEKARYWSTQARDPAPHYEHSEMGFNYRMSNVLAAIGRGQLKVLSERVAARRKVFERYFNALGARPELTFMPEAIYGRSNRWLTTLVLNPQATSVSPLQIINALNNVNVESRRVWKPLHRQPLFIGNKGYSEIEDVWNADFLFDNGLCLPSGSNLTELEQDYIIHQILEILD